MKIVINVTLFHFLCLCIKHTSKLFFNNRLLWLAGCTSEWNSWFKFVLYLNGCALSFLFWGWTTSHSHHPLRLTELLCTERIMSGCCGNGYLVGDCWTDSFVYAQIHVLLFSLAVFHHSFLFFKYQTHHGYDFPLWNVKAKKWTHIWEALCKKKKKKKLWVLFHTTDWHKCCKETLTDIQTAGLCVLNVWYFWTILIFVVICTVLAYQSALKFYCFKKNIVISPIKKHAAWNDQIKSCIFASWLCHKP